MKVNTLKNIAIVILVALAVALTSKLWFENISGHSFFIGNAVSDDAMSAGVKPAAVKPGGDPIEMFSVTVTNPYMSDGGLLKDNIKKLVGYFFPDFASQYDDITKDNVFTYSAGDVVVKYRPGKFDVLEYYNYRLPGKSASPGADYTAALRFIAADKLVTNNYFLADTESADGQSIYYFDYTLRNAPLELGADCETATGLASAIEVTVRNGLVVRYERLVYQFEEGQQ